MAHVMDGPPYNEFDKATNALNSVNKLDQWAQNMTAQMAQLIGKLASDLNPKNLRYLFYLVTPNETIYDNVEDVPNILEPVTLSDSSPYLCNFHDFTAQVIFMDSWIFE
uniref:Uncharacterized protein n=1 Tax=Angiostrongylus cantonensis TaxID=6313 RepID=A0A0K0CV26_ANGCA